MLRLHYDARPIQYLPDLLKSTFSTCAVEKKQFCGAGHPFKASDPAPITLRLRSSKNPAPEPIRIRLLYAKKIVMDSGSRNFSATVPWLRSFKILKPEPCRLQALAPKPCNKETFSYSSGYCFAQALLKP